MMSNLCINCQLSDHLAQIVSGNFQAYSKYFQGGRIG